MTQQRASAVFLNDPDYELNRNLLDQISDLKRRVQTLERQEPGKMVSTLSQAALYMPNITTNSSPSYALVWDNSTGQVQQTALTSVSMARAYGTGTTSATNGTWTAAAMAAENFDTDNYHDNATNNSRITIPANGTYLLIGQINFAASAAGTVRGAAIRANGVSYRAAYYQPPMGATYENALQVSLIYEFVAGDYLQICGFQDTGGALNIINSGTQTPTLGIYRLS